MNLKKRFVFLGCTFTLFIVFFTLQILKEFSGKWEVKGWGAATSRNMNDYVTENLQPHIMPNQFCKEDNVRILLVLVCSGPENFELRKAIRDTWGQKNDNVSFFFLLGEDPNGAKQYKLDMEAFRFGDIIQERFVDSYNNLSIKSTNMLKLFNAHCTNAYKYLMKVDDDVFLNIPLITEMLRKRQNHTDLLLGRVRSNVGPFRNKHSKWYMPYEWYPNDKYPDFLCGVSYIMSVDVAKKLYTCALTVPLLYLEDVFLTGICAQRMNIKVQNNKWFTCDRLRDGICYYKRLYTLHYFSAHEIRYSYDALKKESCDGYTKIDGLQLWLFFFLRS